MSIVRALDQNGDWTFGKGINDYITKNPNVGQSIATRLKEFLGDCFFNLPAGIDWFNQLGAKDQTALQLNISTIIVNTTDVTGLLKLTVTNSAARLFNISYTVQTTYGVLSNAFQYDLNGLV